MDSPVIAQRAPDRIALSAVIGYSEKYEYWRCAAMIEHDVPSQREMLSR
jgi:hypothetical protein